ncbi:unnamed protein product [marine sediment metagenome]|uniref:Uncharacterized protein n=1 Tax=marine sediment metagenome TaxID=412755 RepID=X0THE2_9ZZZZ
MKLLFIGGCVDGKRLEVHDDVVTMKVPVSAYHSNSQYRDNAVMRTNTYKREKVMGPDLVFSVMLYSELTTDHMLRRLLDNYRPAGIIRT